MKYRFIFIAFLLIWNINSYAQKTRIWGTTYAGGDNNYGTIFSLDTTGHDLQIHHHFNGQDGGHPVYNDLLQATDGKLYGLTGGGGNLDSNGVYDGVLYCYDLAKDSFIVKHKFATATGRQPWGALIQTPDGKLYGVTYNGGNNLNNSYGGDGVIFSYDFTKDKYAVEHYFNFKDTLDYGSAPKQGLTLAKDGKLYGTTYNGGRYRKGNIFSFDPITKAYKNLVNLDTTTGTLPCCVAMLQANDGKLYGSNLIGEGTDNGYGNLFSYEPLKGVYSRLFNFKPLGIVKMYGGLLQAQDGQLYGTTNLGGAGGVSSGGVIFKYNIVTGIYTKLYDFADTTGNGPNSTLLQLPNGTMLGLAARGGNVNGGVVFSYSPVANFYSKLIDFVNNTGLAPVSGNLTVVKMPNKTGLVTNKINAPFELTVYPNPFSGSLMVQYYLTERESVVSIDIINILGQTICAYINNEMQTEGKHTIKLNTTDCNLQQGLYFVKLSTTKTWQTAKISYIEKIKQ